MKWLVLIVNVFLRDAQLQLMKKKMFDDTQGPRTRYKTEEIKIIEDSD